MQEKTPAPVSERQLLGTSKVEFEESGKVYVTQLSGRVFEIDLARYRFRSAREAGEFVLKLADRSVFDSIVLSGLQPALVKLVRPL
ncbi:MAG: hypothetical protein IMZ46_05675 [Acidobacteria bacterium]|nr:hypothetical protein [Acidobacteriota bacterium]